MPDKNYAPPPSAPAWRTIATVLIILHLFCLAIAIVSNAGAQPSALGRTLRNVPIAPRYLQALFMDVGYDFELGGVAPRNGLHRLVLLSGAGGETPDGLPASLPSSDTASRIRRQRYQNLAYHIAEFDRVFAESPDDRTRLPLAVAESWIARLELSPAPYTLRCERSDSPRWTIEEETFDAAGRAETAPEESASFDIHLVWSATEGRYGGFRAHPNNLTAKAIGATPE